MKILAVEFSSDERSVAVVEYRDASPALLGRASESGGRRAIGLVEEAFRQAGVEREEIDVLAVGIGPGSYTGIRSAIALAQGYQLGREVRLLGISSVACLAEGARRQGLRGRMTAVVDAQRNEFYVATYHVEADRAREEKPLRLASFGEIETQAHAGEILIGPGIKGWFPEARDMFPDAVDLGFLACGWEDVVPGEKLEPIYLRLTEFKKNPPWRLV